MCVAEAVLLWFFTFIFEEPQTNKITEGLEGFVCTHACVPVTCHVEQDADKFVPEIRYF